MKQVQIDQGRHIIVDDEDFHFVSRLLPTLFIRTDNLGKNRTDGLLETARVRIGGVRIGLAYFILPELRGNGSSPLLALHRNGNGLDFRKENIVIASRAVSVHGNKKAEGCSSRFKGVFFMKKEKYPKAVNRWAAAISSPTHSKPYTKNRIHIGVFPTEIEAALAYNKKAKELYGDEAYQNDIEG